MKILYRFIIFLTILSTTSPLMSLEEVPLPTITLPSPKLKAITLERLNIETKITGNIAQTTYEMGFYNPNDRVLEGDLKIPLLEGQSVVGYALEIKGKYRDAVGAS